MFYLIIAFQLLLCIDEALADQRDPFLSLKRQIEDFVNTSQLHQKGRCDFTLVPMRGKRGPITEVQIIGKPKTDWSFTYSSDPSSPDTIVHVALRTPTVDGDIFDLATVVFSGTFSRETFGIRSLEIVRDRPKLFAILKDLNSSSFHRTIDEIDFHLEGQSARLLIPPENQLLIQHLSRFQYPEIIDLLSSTLPKHIRTKSYVSGSRVFEDKKLIFDTLSDGPLQVHLRRDLGKMEFVWQLISVSKPNQH